MDLHDKLALRKAYNIVTINEDLLTKIACELDSGGVKANLELVRTPTHANYMKLILSRMHHRA